MVRHRAATIFLALALVAALAACATLEPVREGRIGGGRHCGWQRIPYPHSGSDRPAADRSITTGDIGDARRDPYDRARHIVAEEFARFVA